MPAARQLELGLRQAALGAPPGPGHLGSLSLMATGPHMGDVPACGGVCCPDVGTARFWISCRRLANITLVVGAITPIFNVLTSEASLASAIQGALDGVLISFLVGGYHLLVRDGALRPWFRGLAFWTDLTL